MNPGRFFSLLIILITGSLHLLAVLPLSAAAAEAHPALAILPFDNLSGDPYAAVKFRRVLEQALWNAGYNTFTSDALLEEFLDSQEVSIKGMGEATLLREMHRALNSRFALTCSIHQYEMERTPFGFNPQISVTLRIFDCERGDLVMQQKATHSGLHHAWVFGINRVHSLTALAEKAANSLVDRCLVRNRKLHGLLKAEPATEDSRHRQQPASGTGKPLRLAVLPPINYSDNITASKMVEELLNCHLFNQTDHLLVPSAEVARGLLTHNTRDLNAMTAQQISVLCRLWDTDILIFSSIIEFDNRPGQPANVGLVTTLAGRDGKRFFRRTRSRGSIDYQGLFLDREERSISRITSDLCASVTRSILQRLENYQPTEALESQASPANLTSQSPHPATTPAKRLPVESAAVRPVVTPDSRQPQLQETTREILLVREERGSGEIALVPAVLQTTETALRSRRYFNQLLNRIRARSDQEKAAIQDGAEEGNDNNFAISQAEESTQAIVTRYADAREAENYTRLLIPSLRLESRYQTGECQLLSGHTETGARKLFLRLGDKTVYMKSNSRKHLLVSLRTLLQAMAAEQPVPAGGQPDELLRQAETLWPEVTQAVEAVPAEETSAAEALEARLLADTGDRLYRLKDYARSRDLLLKARDKGLATPELFEILASISELEGDPGQAESYRKAAAELRQPEPVAPPRKVRALKPGESIRDNDATRASRSPVLQYSRKLLDQPGRYSQAVQRKPGMAWYRHLVRGALLNRNLKMALTRVQEARQQYPDDDRFKDIEQRLKTLNQLLTDRLQKLDRKHAVTPLPEEEYRELLHLRAVLDISPLPAGDRRTRTRRFDFEATINQIIQRLN